MSLRDQVDNNYALYAWSFDMDELELMGDCFTDDAEVEFAVGLRVGKPAVLEQLNELRENFRPETVPWHVMTNVLITDETETSASVKCFFTFYRRIGDAAPTMSSIGYYDDVFTNDSGTWRVSRRSIVSGDRLLKKATT